MRRPLNDRRDKRRLMLWLILFFLTLSVPAGILIRHAYSQLKWEAFHRHRLMAEEFAARVDRRLTDLIDAEQARPVGDYAFLVASGDPAAGFVQRSPLSVYPVNSPVPGLIGYFQIDARGAFSTPLLPPTGVAPSAYGVSDRERVLRRTLERTLLGILDRNSLVQGKPPQETGAIAGGALRQPARGDESLSKTELDSDLTEAPVSESAPAAQIAFDRLADAPSPAPELKQKASTLGRVEDLKLDPTYQSAAEPAQPAPAKKEAVKAARERRREQAAVYEQQPRTASIEETEITSPPADIRIRLFQSEVGPFEFALLDSGHLVLFRRVWQDGERYVQGALIEPRPFFEGAVASEFGHTALSRASDLAVAYLGDVLAAYSGEAPRRYLTSTDELEGALLYKTFLSAPLGDVELIFSIARLPTGPGGTVVTWVAVLLLVVLSAGLALMYRLGAKHIDLARQQRDFVSAVSHELKTPLTSIRMYAEMLREGWADNGRRKTYYNYIFDESQRLSRLIENVLQLARMTRNDLQLDLKPVRVATLMDGVRSKVASLTDGARFRLNLDCGADAGSVAVRADPDAFAQIVINLVDNAVKFSAQGDNRTIDLTCDRTRDHVRFKVRDYGPGVAADQMKKIFRLFYRSENELTRDTVGTGIGLALVHQLAAAMSGRVDVVNRDPGAEFVVELPIAEG